jgi:hypothetical protein
MPDDELFLAPDGEPSCAVLVLSGSSGRVETDRVRLLAAHGAAALSTRWFGGAGQAPGICEIALESFAPALDRLAAQHERLAVVGLSKGAEAALLLAARDPRIRAVAAFSPTSVVWANVGPGSDGRTHPYRSSWTADGEPLPFVPYDEDWTAASDPPSFRDLYLDSLERFPEAAAAAAIPVQRIAGELLITAGDDDQVWPSDHFAAEIEVRRAAHGLPTRRLTGLGAGHRVRLPGEPEPAGGAAMARGGTDDADAAFGQAIWRELRELLPLRD